MKKRCIHSVFGNKTRNRKQNPACLTVLLVLLVALPTYIILPMNAHANGQTTACGLDGEHAHNTDCFTSFDNTEDSSLEASLRDMDAEGALDINPPLLKPPSGIDSPDDTHDEGDDDLTDGDGNDELDDEKEYENDGKDDGNGDNGNSDNGDGDNGNGDNGDNDDNDDNDNEHMEDKGGNDHDDDKLVEDGWDNTGEDVDNDNETLFDTFDIAPLSVDPIFENYGDGDKLIATVFIPVTKHLDAGEGTFDLLRDSGTHFQIDIEQMPSSFHSAGDVKTNRSVEFHIADFQDEATGEYMPAEGEFKIRIMKHTNDPNGETIMDGEKHTPHRFRISEKKDTAQGNWEYDENVYIIEVIVCQNSGRMIVSNVHNDNCGDGCDIHPAPINGINSTASFMRTDFLYTPLTGTYTHARTDYYHYPTGHLPPSGARFSTFIMRYDEDAAIERFALCTDWYMPEPLMGDDRVYKVYDSRDHTPSVLAFSLFDDSQGARRSIEELNAMFGFDGQEGRRPPMNPDDHDFRRMLIQYALWYFELRDFPSVEFLPWETLDLDANPERDWVVLPVVNRINIGAAAPRRTLYLDFRINAGPDGDELVLYYLPVLRTLDGMMKEYNEGTGAAGESISKLGLRFDPLSDASGNLVIEYTGYRPQPINNELGSVRYGLSDNALELTWEGKATVQVNENTPVDEGPVQAREGDVILVTGITSGVTFTVIDNVLSLARGSVNGNAMGSLGYALSEAPKDIQNIILGTAQFMKISATLSVGSDALEFTNTYSTVFAFPETSGISAGLFYVAGTVSIIIAAVAIFAGSIKPLKPATRSADVSRFMPRIEKRSIKSRREFDRLE